jgi:hypothetical protein
LRPVPLPPAELVKLRLEDDLEAAAGLVPEDVAGERQGHELRPAMGKKAFDRLTALGQAAASRFNERR